MLEWISFSNITLNKDAKNILALEEKAKLEGKDALDVVDDKNSLFRPLPGISDEDEEKSGSHYIYLCFAQ
jgi:hypothetical protein